MLHMHLALAGMHVNYHYMIGVMPHRRVHSQACDERSLLKQQRTTNAAWRHNSTGTAAAALQPEAQAGAGPLQHPLYHSASAPEGQVLYSPTARRPCSKGKLTSGGCDMLLCSAFHTLLFVLSAPSAVGCVKE